MAHGHLTHDTFTHPLDQPSPLAARERQTAHGSGSSHVPRSDSARAGAAWLSIAATDYCIPSQKDAAASSRAGDARKLPRLPGTAPGSQVKSCYSLAPDQALEDLDLRGGGALSLKVTCAVLRTREHPRGCPLRLRRRPAWVRRRRPRRSKAVLVGARTSLGPRRGAVLLLPGDPAVAAIDRARDGYALAGTRCRRRRAAALPHEGRPPGPRRKPERSARAVEAPRRATAVEGSRPVTRRTGRTSVVR